MRQDIVDEGIRVHTEFMRATSADINLTARKQKAIHDWDQFLENNNLTDEEYGYIITHTEY